MKYQTIIVEKKNGYAVVTLNRPHEMNAISKDMRQELYAVIAAVGGIALGGGFNLVTICDLVVASESAIFCHPELKFGFNPFFYPLSQIVGINKAKQIVMLGEPIGANEALNIGLVKKVASPEKFMQGAEKMATEV